MIRSALWTVLFAAAMEWQIAVVLQGSWARFAAVLVFYAVLGVVTHHSFAWVARRASTPARGFWAATVSHGLAGLLVVEWLIMGHAPGSIPDPTLAVIAQAGMFAWWCTMAAMPRVLDHPLGRRWRTPVLLFYGVYAVASSVGALRLGLAPVILSMPPVYCLSFFVYFRFGRALRAHETTA